MNDPLTSFENAWARFQSLDSLHLAGDSSEWEWTRGRAQSLAFQVQVEDAAARHRVAQVVGRLADIPGVEPFPDWFWHVTVKLAGFQVIKRSREDDIPREDVPRIAGKARALLAHETAFEARLGPANGFASVVFLEVWDDGGLRRLNARLADGLPELPSYPIDGDGFLPHVSIARFTSSDGLEELNAVLAELRSEGPGPSFPIRRVAFVKAWLSEAVPEFDTLASYTLRSAR